MNSPILWLIFSHVKGTKTVSMSIVNEMKLSGKFSTYWRSSFCAQENEHTAQTRDFSLWSWNKEISCWEITNSIRTRDSLRLHGARLLEGVRSDRKTIISTNMLRRFRSERQTWTDRKSFKFRALLLALTINADIFMRVTDGKEARTHIYYIRFHFLETDSHNRTPSRIQWFWFIWLNFLTYSYHLITPPPPPFL